MLIGFSCPKCDTKLEVAAAEAGTNVPCPACGTPVTIPAKHVGPGSTIGDFKLKKLIGEGGMGQVFLADQLSMGRDVAVKILPAQLTLDKELVNRFLREVRLAARLEHPNIVTAYAAGEDDGVYYMAMAYVKGQNLHDKLDREGAMPEKEALLLIRKVASALASAWDEHGLLHRDVKPENIILDKKGEPKLLDLGLSKTMDEAGGLSSTSMIVGTPNFAAPEQIDGEEEVDFRADMYSLGTTLYHMLTNKIPFHAATVSETFRKQATEPLPDPRDINANISAHCVELMGFMLTRRPEHRHSSWSALIADIDRVVAGKKPAKKPLEAGESLMLSVHAAKAATDKPHIEVRRSKLREAHAAAHTDEKPPAKVGVKVALGVAGVLVLLGVSYGLMKAMQPIEEEPAPVVVVPAPDIVKPEPVRPDAPEPPAPEPPAPEPPAPEPEPMEEVAEPVEPEPLPPAVPIPGAVAPFTADEAARHQHRVAALLDMPVDSANSLGMAMKLIPPGTFMMGLSEEDAETSLPDVDKSYNAAHAFELFVRTATPQHQVTLTRPFYLGTHEVTVGQFRAFVEASGHTPYSERKGELSVHRGRSTWKPARGLDWRSPGFPQTDNHPAIGLSHNDAVAFCGWLSEKEGRRYRLPTEAEWEFACRAGTTTRFYSGDSLESQQDVANAADEAFKAARTVKAYAAPWDDGYAFTAPVGSFEPNAFGLYDMHGNVFEVCSDFFGEKYYETSPEIDPAGPGKGDGFMGNRFPVRGGAFISVPNYSAARNRTGRDGGLEAQGFRVVCEIPEAPASAVAVEPEGETIVLAARDAEIHGTGVRYEARPDRDWIGGWSNPDAWVSWNVTLRQSGVYAVEVLQAAGPKAGGSLVLSVGDHELKGEILRTGWRRFETVVLGEVVIATPGEHDVALRPTAKHGKWLMDLKSVTLTLLKAEASAPVDPAAANLDALTDAVAGDLLEMDFDAARSKLADAEHDEEMRSQLAAFAALTQTVEGVASLPAAIIASYEDDVGKEITVYMDEGAERLEIVSVGPRQVRAQKVLRSGDRVIGSSPRHFTIRQLSVREKVKRLGSEVSAERDIMRGLLAHELGNDEVAVKYLGRSETPLGEALAARLRVQEMVVVTDQDTGLVRKVNEADAVRAFRDILDTAHLAGAARDIDELVLAIRKKTFAPVEARNIKLKLRAFRKAYAESEIAGKYERVLDLLEWIVPGLPLYAEKQDMERVLKELEAANPQRQKFLASYEIKDHGIEMNLASNPELKDLGPLARKPVVSLDLSDTKVKNLDPLRQTPLQRLTLHRCPIDSLRPLSQLYLRELSVAECRSVTSLQPLSSLPLETLNVGHTQIDDLRPLMGLPLESLAIYGCRGITDLRPLRGMALKRLDISGTSAGDLEPLRGMPLESLKVEGWRVENFEPLKGMTTLERIEGDGRAIWSRFNRPVYDALLVKDFARATRMINETVADFMDVPAFKPYIDRAQSIIETHIPAFQFLEANPERIPLQAKEFDGHHYLLCIVPMDWDDAADFCEQYDAHLATITSEQESLGLGENKVAGGMTAWLGGTNRGGGNRWRWVTGEPWKYTHWAGGQPQPKNVPAEQWLIRFAHKGEWHDVTDSARVFIMEWDR